jgi:hypothetical protein
MAARPFPAGTNDKPVRRLGTRQTVALLQPQPDSAGLVRLRGAVIVKPPASW